MKPIIGLIRSESGEARAIQRLKEAGFPEERISLITQEKAVNDLLGCEPSCVITRYAAWGVFLGIAAYFVSAVLAGLCQCNLFQYGPAYGIGTFIGGILAGAFVGGVIGYLVGVAESEEASHLYIQGIRMGGKVIAVQSNDQEAGAAKRILEQERAWGVKAL